MTRSEDTPDGFPVFTGEPYCGHIDMNGHVQIHVNPSLRTGGTMSHYAGKYARSDWLNTNAIPGTAVLLDIEEPATMIRQPDGTWMYHAEGICEPHETLDSMRFYVIVRWGYDEIEMLDELEALGES